MANLFDENGREIMVGDVLKVFHFTAALRRKKHYMYKQVVKQDVFRDGTPYLKVSHLDLTDDGYTLICDGSHLRGYEIVQDIIAKLDDRPRTPPAQTQPVEAQTQEKVVGSVPCPCTMIEQDEDCIVGYPSIICGVCEGKGHTTPEQVTALACEMIKIASDVGEPDDPFAAWESVSLIQSQNEQMRKALKDMLPPKLTWKERDADGFLVHHKVAAINAARAALATASGVEG